MPSLERYGCYNTSYVTESRYLCFERDTSVGFKERIVFYPPDYNDRYFITTERNTKRAYYDDWEVNDRDILKKIDDRDILKKN